MRCTLVPGRPLVEQDDSAPWGQCGTVGGARSDTLGGARGDTPPGAPGGTPFSAPTYKQTINKVILLLCRDYQIPYCQSFFYLTKIAKFPVKYLFALATCDQR